MAEKIGKNIGVAGLAIPERYGGAGGSQVEMNVVAEELVRALAPSPLLGSAVLTARAIFAIGITWSMTRIDTSSGHMTQGSCSDRPPRL